MTLVELMFVVAIMAVIVAGITKVMIDLAGTSRVRDLGVSMQGEGRTGLQLVERDVRQASLGSTVGVIWTQDSAGNVAQRPSVQLFDNVSGTGASLDVKPGTDALLLVGSRVSGGQTAAQGSQYNATETLSVTDTTGFAVGDAVLAGPYLQAAWGTVEAMVVASPPTPGGLNLDVTQNVYPNGKLDAGSMVRSARSRLYYVNNADELVQVELRVPRAPASAEEIASSDVIARGVENLQVDCETDTGVAAGACPAAMAADPASTEAAWALGTWVGGGARFNSASIPNLRSIVLQVVMRSQSALVDGRGDEAIAIGNQTALQAGGSDATQRFIRRSYRMPIAVRNVSLGAL